MLRHRAWESGAARFRSQYTEEEHVPYVALQWSDFPCLDSFAEAPVITKDGQCRSLSAILLFVKQLQFN